MKFCPDCQNFLYVLEEGDGVGFKCRKCPYVEKISHANPLVYEHKLKEDRATQLVMNENLEHDPTLPRFTTIRCPTQGCPSNDVVAVKLSREDVIWMYKCAVCKVAWKQAARR
jgi:DNA-directed RNA polymerase subunit M/transcription elongation factor TFIIS